MRGSEFTRFVKKVAFSIVKSMIVGGVIMGILGLLIAVAAAVFGGAGPLTLEKLLNIAWNYAKIGLFGGGLLGLIYGLLTQGSSW